MHKPHAVQLPNPLRFLGRRIVHPNWLVGLCLAATWPAFSAEPALNKTSLALEVGKAEQLHSNKAGKASVRWVSSAPDIVEVFQNGFVIGLAAGQASVTAVSATGNTECVVTVTPAKSLRASVDDFKQYPDSREFTVKGRKCFGSELNGQRAFNPDEKRYTRSNRVINPRPLNSKKPLEWELENGAEVYDGTGVLMGTVAAELQAGDRTVPASMFNFGMSKILGGRLCLYAFSVPIKPSPAVSALVDPAVVTNVAVRTSAWLPLDRVVDKEGLLGRIGVGRPGMPVLALDDKHYRITGGNPRQYETESGELSIIRDVKVGAVPSHYLRRPSGTINIIYSVPGFGLGGQGLDSVLVSDGLEFTPAKGAKVFVQPTYFPKRHPQAGKVSPQTMTFMYGAVTAKGMEPVYGWVAKEALE